MTQQKGLERVTRGMQKSFTNFWSQTFTAIIADVDPASVSPPFNAEVNYKMVVAYQHERVGFFVRGKLA